MSYTSNQINSQSLNGIISLSDGVLNIEDGIISNIQQLNVIGNSELDGDLIVDGKISCAYNALLPSDVVNKSYVDDALNNNSRFLRVDGTNKMNANLNVGDKYIYNLLDPSGNQDASTKYYTDTADNLRLLKSGGIMTGILDMSANRIIKLATGIDDTDCINKLQMVNADNLRLLKSGDTMTGILDLSGNRIIKLATGIDDTDGINKLQMNNADNLRLLKAGDTMSGNLDMSGNNIININNLASATSSYLHLLIGNTIFIQLTPEQVIFRAPILINNIAVGGTGIYMAGTKVSNLSNGTNPQDGVNKQQMDDADNTRLKLDGSTAMTGSINCNGNNITNIGSIQSQISSNLNLQSGTTTIMQIQPLKVLMSMPIDMNSKLINLLGNGVNDTDAVNKKQMDDADNTRLKLDGSSAMTGALNMNSKTINNCPILTAGTSMTFIIGTTTIMQTLANQLLMNMPINMNSKLINGLGNGVATTDAVNKSQMDTADLLKMNKANGIGTGLMTLTHTTDQLKLINSNTTQQSGNLIIQSNLTGSVDFWDTNGLTSASIQASSADRTMILSGAGVPSVILSSTLVKLLKPAQITGTLTMTTGGLSPIDMSGNFIKNLPNGVSALDGVNKQQLDLKLNLTGGTLSNTLTFSGGGIDMSGYNITKVSNIYSNTTNPIIIHHNNVPIVQIDASGITMQFAADINMAGGEISNTSLIMPIKTSTTSSYSTINSNYLNIGYTASKSYNIYTTIAPTTSTRLLGASGSPPVDNKLSVAAGVWIITAMFNPFCTTGTPNSSRIQMFVSNVNTATAWTAFPASNCHQMLNGNYDSNDSARMVNTFVIHLTASSTDLYLWGIIDYSGGTAWGYDYAELKATRIA